MFKHLRNRLILINMALLTVVMVLAFATIYAITYNNITAENTRRLAALAPLAVATDLGESQQSVQGSFAISAGTRVEGPLIGGFTQLPTEYAQSFVLIIDADDSNLQQVLTRLDYGQDVYETALSLTLAQGHETGTIKLEDRVWLYRITNDIRMQVVRQGEMPDGFFLSAQNPTEALPATRQVAFLDVTDSTTTLWQLLLTFVVVGLAMLLALFVISRLLANRSIRPLEQSWEKQRQFVADASHELKTPLGIINANREALLANEGNTVASQRHWIDNIALESTRMHALVNDLLYLARTEEGPAARDRFDLSLIVGGVLTEFEALLFEGDIQVEVTVPGNVRALGDEETLRQVVRSLLDNAVKYTPAGGRVTVGLVEQRGSVVLTIANTAEQIPADQLEKLFDRFYRCDSAHSRETEGFGLGLALAKAAVERSGGTINVASTPEVTTFTVTLKSA